MIDLPPILRRLDDERRSFARPGEMIDALPDVTRLRCGGEYSISWSSLNEANADAAITREIAHHQALGVGFEWKTYAHDSPADLRERLARHGFTIGSREAVLVYDLADTPAWMNAPSECAVFPVEDAARLADFRRAAAGAFGHDCAATAEALAAALAAGSAGHRGYVAYVGPVPVAVGRLYADPRSHFAGLYGGGTRPEFRGRGYYRAVVAARARDAVRFGSRYLQVDALPTSRPILERLGFRWLTDTWPCRCECG